MPAGVLALPGGPDSFLRLLTDQRDRRRRRDVPDVGRDPGLDDRRGGLRPGAGAPARVAAHARRRPARDARRSPDRRRRDDSRGPVRGRVRGRRSRRRAGQEPAVGAVVFRIDASIRSGERSTFTRACCARTAAVHVAPVLLARATRNGGVASGRRRGGASPQPAQARRSACRRAVSDRRRHDVFERLGAYDPGRRARARRPRRCRAGRLRTAARGAAARRGPRDGTTRTS